MKTAEQLSHKIKFYLMCGLQKFGSLRQPQIRLKDMFGASLEQTVRRYKPKRILEIGAWDGRGSTTCLLSKMYDQPEFMDCVECYAQKANCIRKKIVPFFPFVKVHQCSTITYDEWFYKDFDRDVWNAIPQDLQNRLRYQVWKNMWLNEEKFLKTTDNTYFQQNPNKQYDMVLIDGGEFTGHNEFHLLERRFSIIAFDDMFSAFKNYWPYQEMLKDRDYELISCSKFVRNGFAIFAKKGLKG